MTDPTPKRAAFQAQVKILNLGAIKEADLELRPLTVIFGKNGVNKTWAAYSIVEAMGTYPVPPESFSVELESRLRDFHSSLKEAVAEIRRQVLAAGALPSSREGKVLVRRKRVGDDLDALLHGIRKELNWSAHPAAIALAIGVPQSVVAAARVSVGDVTVDAVSAGYRGLGAFVTPSSDYYLAEVRDLSRWSGRETSQLVELQQNIQAEALKGFAFDVERPDLSRITSRPECDWDDAERQGEFVADLIDAANRGWLTSANPFYLPAERKAVSTFIHHLDAATELQGRLRFSGASGAPQFGSDLAADIGLNRAVKLLGGSAHLPLPVRRLVGWLVGASTQATSAGSNEESPGGMVPALGSHLAQILSGTATFSEPGASAAVSGYGTMSLVFRFGDGQQLPFQAASSLAGSLGLLGIWLKSQAQPGDLVVIDEPEMNAHPETQVKIAELLAMMINAGLRVIITTHSPYLVEHLEGLMLGSRLSPEAKERFVPRLGLQSAAAFLDPEDIAVYHFEEQQEGEVKVLNALNREDCSIDWGTFSRPRTYVGNLINNILAEVSPEQSEDDGSVLEDA